MKDLFTCDETKEKFIIALQNHACLYNPQATTYSNRQCRMNAWQVIAQECGVPGKGENFFIRKILLIYHLLCINGVEVSVQFWWRMYWNGGWLTTTANTN